MREAAETRWTCGVALLFGALSSRRRSRRMRRAKSRCLPPPSDAAEATSLGAAKDLIGCASWRSMFIARADALGTRYCTHFKNAARGCERPCGDDSRFLQGDVVWAPPWAMPRRPPRRRGASATVRLVVREKQQGLEGRPDDVIVRDAAVLGGEGVAHEHVALLLRQLQLAPRNRLEERGWVEQA